MRYLLIFLFLTFVSVTWGQDSDSKDNEKKEGRPDVPGKLLLDFGYSFSPVEKVSFDMMGSRTVNLYYMQDFRFGTSKFSFHPGIGLGAYRYRVGKNDNDQPQVILHSADSAYFIVDNETSIIKNMLIANYVEIPVEFRFSTSPDDKPRSFNVMLGGKIGLLGKSQSKLKYKENEIVAKLKDQRNFHISPLRYSAYLRIGVGGFNVFADYSISPLFIEGEGPEKKTLNMLTTGISFDLF